MATKQKTSKLPSQKVLGSQLEFEHDLFKLDVATFKRNVSWKYLEPRLLEAEHVHWYHSKNSKGKYMQYSTAVGGHKHEVTIDWETGKATCGPAITLEAIKIPNTHRVYKKWVPVGFDAVNMDTGEPYRIVDDHTHEIKYIKSDIMSEATTREMQAKDRAQIAPMISQSKIPVTPPIKQLENGEYSNSKAESTDSE
jgi:hypothetical protein